jgi:hypothetical protein
VLRLFCPLHKHTHAQEEDEVIDVQCGYRALDPLDRNYYRRPNATNEIYSVGCRQAAEDLFNDNLEIILGVGVGLLIFQLFNIMLAGGLALDIRKEKAALKAIKESQRF